MAACTFRVGNSSRYCKDIPVVTVGQFRSDHASAFYAGFNYDCSVTNASNNSVAAGKIVFVWFNSASEFRKNASTFFYHFLREVAVFLRIHLVKAMGYYAKCRQVMPDSSPV